MRILIVLGTLLVGVMVMAIPTIALVRRNRPRGAGSLGNAMHEIEGLFVESKQHILRADRAEEAEEEATPGDPPEK